MQVVGIDEVGRGALAGPLVAAAVILPTDFITPLYDSKKITKNKREELAQIIHSQAEYVGLGWVSNADIDTQGLAWALKTAYMRALSSLDIQTIDRIILDGNVNYLSEYSVSETMVQADGKVACVSAASIVAKVARDAYMRELTHQYPQYGYDTNVGYGSAQHRLAIALHGLTDMHRLSFCTKLVHA